MQRQSGGPPKKRAKKPAPNSHESTLRRSARTQRKTKEWWKSNPSPSGSEDEYSSDSDVTYNVPTRRRGGKGGESRSNRNKNQQTKSRKKESAKPKRSSAKRSKSSNSRAKNTKNSEKTKTAKFSP